MRNVVQQNRHTSVLHNLDTSSQSFLQDLSKQFHSVLREVRNTDFNIEKRLSPNLVGTNNPFRRSPVSPSFPPSQVYPSTTPPPIDNPKNPFIDNAEVKSADGRKSPAKMTEELLMVRFYTFYSNDFSNL